MSIMIGDVEVIPVVEKDLWIGPIAERLTGADLATWEDNRDWLVPEHWRPEQSQYRTLIQTWVLRSSGGTIVIDTGAGNGRDRPGSSFFSGLDTDFMGDLQRAGVDPNDVDAVINSHIHVDHVGWNTRQDGSDWIPTFPNARYFVTGTELAFWHPDNVEQQRGARFNQGVYADAITPVIDAGLMNTWEDEYQVTSEVTLRSWPGHTPGHAVVSVASSGERALFIGDMLHTPMQILEPHVCATGLDEDPDAAVAARRRLLAMAADQRAWVFGGHVAGGRGVQVTPAGSGFTIDRWAQLEDRDRQ